VRPLSPKGYSELIFKDAATRIRRTGQDFQYQLVVQRAYEEGEEELGEDAEEEDEDLALSGERDEKVFLLDEALHFRTEIREGGEKVIAWRDLSGDAGDVYEFVCDNSIQAHQVEDFDLIARQCQYERKFRRSHEIATQDDLDSFVFEEQAIPAASPIHSSQELSPINRSSMPQPPVPRGANIAAKRDRTPTRTPRTSALRNETPTPEPKIPEKVVEQPTAAPAAAGQPAALEILAKETAELHLFDFVSGAFIMQDSEVEATVSEIGKWQYWLQISGKEREWLGQAVIADLNPIFNFEFLSFIFNHYGPDGSAYSWLLRFKDSATIERFQEGLMQALWEQLNEIKWNRVKEDDHEYVRKAFEDLEMTDVPDEEEEEEEEEEIIEEEEEDEGQRSEQYDTDEDEDDVETGQKDGNTNSQLAVGYKHDRSFVVRGSKIGVFKHTPNNHLEFSTNISRVETPQGKLFSPKKVMLHSEDTSLILQNGDNPNSLYRMDLEYGKVVDEWKIHDDIPINTFTPETKFAQMTSQQTFLGLSKNALYRIDPRLAGSKLVGDTLKQYASKNDFSAAATTEKGYIAVASNKGDIRMFDRLGINAKTHIPALGEPIIGLDVSADGRWVLATCRTYLLLIDAMQHEGDNAGKLGFQKSFAKNAKPQPRRLGLTPNHVAQFQHETGAPLSFTPARFNAGEGMDETSIISATGPFIVTWSLKKVVAGKKDPYSIKRYAEEVKADNFKYGSDKNVIVALPNEVNMIAKGSLRKPTRESIALLTPQRGSAGRRESGRIGTRESARYKLGRDDVVNSPY
jgi:hypothetical protein